MTDRFEDDVRRAARGLPGPEPMPTYHGAWKHGRRRKVVKQASVAVAGALALVVAMSAGIGNFGQQSTEIDDLATGATVATASPQVAAIPATPTISAAVRATEPPLPTVTPIPPAAAASGVEAAPAQSDEQTTTATAPAQEPTRESAPVPTTQPSAQPGQSPTVAPTPTSTVEAPAALAPPPSATPVAPTPTAEVAPNTAFGVDPTPEPTATELAVEQATKTPTVTPTPADFATVPAPTVASEADATVTGDAIEGLLPCDTDADGSPDASCSLLAPYVCVDQSEARAGYTVIDTNGDGTTDTCVAVGLTNCDTTGDGLGDTPCIIELDPQPLDADE